MDRAQISQAEALASLHKPERMPGETQEQYKARRRASAAAAKALQAMPSTIPSKGHVHRKPRPSGQHPKLVEPRQRKPKAAIKPTWPRTVDQRKQSRPVTNLRPLRHLANVMLMSNPPDAKGVRSLTTDQRDELRFLANAQPAHARPRHRAHGGGMSSADDKEDGFVLAPAYRGYAHLGTGQYLINHSAPGTPAELIISIASEADKAGRVVGDERDNPEGKVIQPEVIAVLLRFENVAGLDALEQQLRYLREVHFQTEAA